MPRVWVVAMVVLLLGAESCSVVDSKYYDRLVRNGSGGGRDEDAGENPDAEVDAAPGE
jgi:hypothetical protein